MKVNGFSAELKWHESELGVLKKLYSNVKGIEEHQENFNKIRAASNTCGLTVLEESLKIFEDEDYSSKKLDYLSEWINGQYKSLREQLLLSMKEFRAKQS
jgi:hypothetical protein